MEFFSWIGSAVGSIASGISNVVSSISSGLSAAIDRVGEIIKSGISTLGKLVTTTIKTLRDICPKGANFLHEISQAVTKLLTPVLGPFLAPVVTSIIMDVINNIFMSLLTPINENPLDNEQIEEYGALLEQSEKNNWDDGDKFDTVNEHYEYLKSKAKEENIEIKPVERLSVESMKRRTIAMSELWERLEKREEITISQDFLIFSALKAFTPERVQAIINASKEMGFSAVKFSDLRNGKLDPDITKKYNLTIVSQLKEIYENKGITITDDEAINELANMKTSVEEIKFMEPLKDKFDLYAALGERLFNKNSLENEYKNMM
ncbi:hypothetical protein [Veillonella infantium]|uniref:Uncharacterized protein n=1 Tax=Veillonella infantium TaxID=1911679 RepID=A0ABX5C301_9FIRM|nr:hypothetical protein [Veillonella infantium]PQL57725.1 hypothetical protein VCHSUH03_05185 [Veillonella infantium]